MATHFLEDLFKCIFLNETFCTLRVQSTITHHWFGKWHDTKSMIIHYLYQWWLSSTNIQHLNLSCEILIPRERIPAIISYIMTPWHGNTFPITGPFWKESPVASFTEEVNPRLAKCPLVFNGRLANRRLTSFVNEATGHWWIPLRKGR